MASLPKKTEEVLTVPMQEEQKRLYMRILTDLRQQQERREAAYAEQEKAKNRALQSETRRKQEHSAQSTKVEFVAYSIPVELATVLVNRIILANYVIVCYF